MTNSRITRIISPSEEFALSPLFLRNALHCVAYWGVGESAVNAVGNKLGSGEWVDGGASQRPDGDSKYVLHICTGPVRGMQV
jgi:hypothetical protein